MINATLRLLLAASGVVLAFVILFLLVYLFPEPFGSLSIFEPWLLVRASKCALWPSLLGARLALYPSWLALPVVAGFFYWTFRRLARSIKQPYRRAFLVAFMASTLYLGSGWIYVHIWPVPRPAFPLGQAPDWKTFRYDLYFDAFDTGYRWGMLDEWVEYHGMSDPATRQGEGHGYTMGLAEWDGVLPGITRSRLPHERRTSSQTGVKEQ